MEPFVEVSRSGHADTLSGQAHWTGYLGDLDGDDLYTLNIRLGLRHEAYLLHRRCSRRVHYTSKGTRMHAHISTPHPAYTSRTGSDLSRGAVNVGGYAGDMVSAEKVVVIYRLPGSERPDSQWLTLTPHYAAMKDSQKGTSDM